jgi:hypothetical protein
MNELQILIVGEITFTVGDLAAVGAQMLHLSSLAENSSALGRRETVGSLN